MKLSCHFRICILQFTQVIQFLDTFNEELQLLQYLFQDLDVLIVDWLMEQIIKAKATSDDKHQTLIKFGSNIKKDFIIVLQLQAIIFNVKDHSHLLLIKEFPNFKNTLQMISSNLVKVSLLCGKLLLVLFFKHLEIKVKKPLYFRRIFSL